MSVKLARENARQHQALLAYSSMSDPSLQKLHQTWAKHLPKFKKPSYSTLKEWSAKYQWVSRSQAIHQKAKDEAIRKTVDQLVMVKEEILAITRSVMTKFGKQLDTNKQGMITIMDFEKAWKIQRVELGLPTEIGKQDMAIKDSYEGVSDEELVEKLEFLTKRYKERLKEKKQKPDHKFLPMSPIV
mgnify:CR=1 FL=1